MATNNQISHTSLTKKKKKKEIKFVWSSNVSNHPGPIKQTSCTIKAICLTFITWLSWQTRQNAINLLRSDIFLQLNVWGWQINTRMQLGQFYAKFNGTGMKINWLCFKWQQGRNRKIFLRGQSHFSWFFCPAWNAFSRYKISILVATKQIYIVFKSEKQKKKKKKKILSSFSNIFLLLFSISTFLKFSFFSFQFSPFSIFSLPLFPGRAAKISRSEVSGGGHSAPCPHLLCHWMATPVMISC